MYIPGEKRIGAGDPGLSFEAPAGSVDVVIPVRDGARTILAALNSVLSQTSPPRRIIVIDDGSPDATANIVANIRLRIH